MQRASESKHITVRGRRYHLRTWGKPSDKPLFLLHGAMDSSAAFQFTVDHLPEGRYYVAPDWCGYGKSEPLYNHWYPDYLADIDAVLETLSPGAPAEIVGHSRGGNALCLYAGARPERVAKLMTVEGLGFSYGDDTPDQTVDFCAAWLGEQRERRTVRPYDSVELLAAALHKNNKGLTAERAAFLAREWHTDAGDGKVRFATVFVPREKEGVRVSTSIAMAFWRRITAPVCYVYGDLSHFTKRCIEHPEDYESRKACFRSFEDAEIKGAGHTVHYDQPEALAAHIVRFFDLPLAG